VEAALVDKREANVDGMGFWRSVEGMIRVGVVVSVWRAEKGVERER
jgi:hypothetical protein